MSSKNAVVTVLALWAIGATLLVMIQYNRTGYTHQCTDLRPEMSRSLTGSRSAGEERKELSDTERRSNSSQDTVRNAKSVDQNVASNASRVDGSKHFPNGHLAHVSGLQKYVSKIFRPEKHDDSEEFTMIMLTYKRVSMLSRLIKHYCGAKKLHKILVIWNNVDEAIPQHILDLTHTCQTRLEFIQEKENKLTNRFKPRPEIETECKYGYNRMVDFIQTFKVRYSLIQVVVV